MESYMVCVYKREQKEEGTETICGIVEDPATGLRLGFESIEELGMIIGASPGRNKHKQLLGEKKLSLMK